MYKVLDKDTIKTEIMPHLSTAKRGYKTKGDMIEVINGILYKLKTGCQWHMLPVKSLFTGRLESLFGDYVIAGLPRNLLVISNIFSRDPASGTG